MESDPYLKITIQMIESSLYKRTKTRKWTKHNLNLQIIRKRVKKVILNITRNKINKKKFRMTKEIILF